MPAHFLHLVLGSVLLGTAWCDALFLRSRASLVFQPTELIAAWRTRIAILEMLLLLAVVVLGAAMWLPKSAAYPGGTFHPKIALAIAALVLGKVRMLRERRDGQPGTRLTWAFALCVTVVFCLGARWGVGGTL